MTKFLLKIGRIVHKTFYAANNVCISHGWNNFILLIVLLSTLIPFMLHVANAATMLHSINEILCYWCLLHPTLLAEHNSAEPQICKQASSLFAQNAAVIFLFYSLHYWRRVILLWPCQWALVLLVDSCASKFNNFNDVEFLLMSINANVGIMLH